MNTLKQTIARHPLTWFFVLAYALSWWTAPLMNGALFPYGPMLAAILVVLAMGGRQALTHAWRANTPARVPWRWYLIAPGIILAIHLGTLGLLALWGVRAANTAHLAFLGTLLLELLFLGGQWEEPGWSGFALPALQARFANHRFGLLWASLVLGALRTGWHLPLAVFGLIPWIEFFVLGLPFQFIVSWLYNRSGGSLAVVMLYHFAANVFGIAFVPLFAEADRPLHFVIKIGLFVITALALVLLDARRWITPKRESQASKTGVAPQP